jgi:hypothetical protein
MRRFSSPTNRYTVQVSPPAWRQIAHLSAGAFRHMRQGLETLGLHVPPELMPPLDAPEGSGSRVALSTVIADHVVFYEVNTALQLITVLELESQLARDE